MSTETTWEFSKNLFLVCFSLVLFLVCSSLVLFLSLVVLPLKDSLRGLVSEQESVFVEGSQLILADLCQGQDTGFLICTVLRSVTTIKITDSFLPASLPSFFPFKLN